MTNGFISALQRLVIRFKQPYDASFRQNGGETDYEDENFESSVRDEASALRETSGSRKYRGGLKRDMLKTNSGWMI